MFKIEIKNRLTNEITNGATFETEELANAWIALQEAKGIKRKAFGRYYCEMDTPKKGLNYEGEIDYNESLVESEFIKNFDYKDPEQWVHLLAEYIIETEDITAEHELQKLINDTIAIGNMYGTRCKRALGYISGCNVNRELTEDQIDSMEVTFADAKEKLLIGRPDKAYSIIADITPDGIIVTDEIKTNVINILTGVN